MWCLILAACGAARRGFWFHAGGLQPGHETPALRALLPWPGEAIRSEWQGKEQSLGKIHQGNLLMPARQDVRRRADQPVRYRAERSLERHPSRTYRRFTGGWLVTLV